MSFTQKMRNMDSRNVVAKITGADPTLKNEYIVYTGHWDHFGISTPVNGDNIYNGARDNATGTAMLLEFARAFKKVRPAAKRTIVFVSVTAEEQGLLGSEYYAKFPLYPLDKTLANINVDAMNISGRRRTYDCRPGRLGARHLRPRRRHRAGPRAEAGLRAGEGLLLPLGSLQLREGRRAGAQSGSRRRFLGKPADYGQPKRDEYTTQAYHQPSDEVKDWWDLSRRR